MLIPENFRGVWQGEFKDKTVEPYSGKITIDAQSVTAVYYMFKTRISTPEIISAYDDELVLHEDCDSFHGHIKLNINEAGVMTGNWIPGKRLTNRVTASALLMFVGPRPNTEVARSQRRTLDQMTSLQSQYSADLTGGAVWPMKIERIKSIYRTMARAISDASNADKGDLFTLLLEIADEFQVDAPRLTKSQAIFEEWHEDAMRSLRTLPFSWRDRSGDSHRNMSLGLTQKFLNLMLKDWWGSGACSVLDFSVLHAPFDNVIWNEICRLTPSFDLPSLKNGSSYRGISVWEDIKEYNEYQRHLTSSNLRTAVSAKSQRQLTSAGLSSPPETRTEIEQLLWHRQK
jgi:hypothetical protein